MPSTGLNAPRSSTAPPAEPHPSGAPRAAPSIRLRMALVVLAVLAASAGFASRSVAAIPEPTATAQAALLGACVDLTPVRSPVTDPLRAVCAAVVIVYTDLLSEYFREHLLHRVYLP